MEHTIFITGASGYLGSAISVDLARDNRVIGICRREPAAKQKSAAPRAIWEKGEVADEDCLDAIFRRHFSAGRPIEYVIHFAAFTDYGEKWRDEYCDTNVIGTRNIIEVATRYPSVKRIIFAGSIAALNPAPKGEVLTEKTPACGHIAYSRSKALGEKLLARNSHRIPVAVLRIGGVFTDWCELPPLFSVIKEWSRPFTGRLVPGGGNTGFPYIHRRDIVRIMRRIIEKNECLNRYETLFASHPGYTSHNDLFPIIRGERGKGYAVKPIRVPPLLAKSFLHCKYLLNTLRKTETYERSWMIDYVDRPLVVDTTYTQNRLNWIPTPDLHILKRLPILMRRFNKHNAEWHARNIRRNDQKYEYDPDVV